MNSITSQFAARFKREARAIAQIQHPNMLLIYDDNEQNGTCYLVPHIRRYGRLRDYSARLSTSLKAQKSG